MKVESLVDLGSLPILITPSRCEERSPESLKTWLRNTREEWTKFLRHSGGILFRGFEITRPIELEHIAELVGDHPINYIGGNSPRTKVTNAVYTSTEYPSDQIITLHNELSYAQSWPTHVLFWCDVPPREGGETPIIDGRIALRLLPPVLLERFERKGLTYIQTLHGGKGLGRSWQATFETNEKSDVERILGRSGIQFEWMAEERLQVRYHRKATDIHPITGESIWFSQADQWHPSTLGAETLELMTQTLKQREFPHNVTFGDGEPIDEKDVSTIRNILWDNATVFPWRKGDLLILDNMLAAHGRRAFNGKRKVYVAMT